MKISQNIKNKFIVIFLVGVFFRPKNIDNITRNK